MAWMRGVVATAGAALLVVSCNEQTGPTETVSIISGNNQSAAVGSPLNDPLVISVTDASGLAIRGAAVTWTVSGGGTLSASSTTTDSTGRTHVTCTLGPTTGVDTVQAAVVGGASATFTAMATAPATSGASITIAGGNNQITSSGNTLQNPIVVFVADQTGKPLIGVSVTWAVTTGGGSLSATTAVTGPDGKSAVTWTLGATPGTQTVTATVGGLTPVTFTATGT
jgi:Bacterial Ig-like domain (group 1)